MLPVQDVAKFIIQRSGRVSSLKLQKLLYYAQGWRLGLTGKPLFEEDFQAWVHGPVVPVIYRTYKEYGWRPIDLPNPLVQIEASKEKHVMNVLRVYGKYDAVQLEKLSHKETPWKTARVGIDPKASCEKIMSKDSMRKYFAAKAQA